MSTRSRRSPWAARLPVWSALVSLAAGQSSDDWLSTIGLATTQQRLSQEISKEFFLIAAAFNVEHTKAKLQSNIATFDANLQHLIDGYAPGGIIAAPATRVLDAYTAVSSEWALTKADLETDIDKVANASADEKLAMVGRIAHLNVPLLEKSTSAMTALVEAAAVSGVHADVALGLAGRQRMLIEKICKDVLLVSLGVRLDYFLEELSETRQLFKDSNDGLVGGSLSAGVPMVTKVCSLQAMQKVRDAWEDLSIVLDKIFVERHAEEARKVALAEAGEIVSGSTKLSGLMAEATELFATDDGSCDTLFAVTTAGWGDLVNIIGLQRQEFEKMVATFMHIANNAAVQESTTTLSVTISGASIRFMSIISGNLANNIFPPPTQDIANDVINARSAFLRMEYLLVRATFEVGITKVACSLIALLSEEIGEYLRQASDKYVALAEQYAPSVLPSNIYTAGRQRTLFEKMTKLACLTAYGIDVVRNFEELNASRDLYKESHRGLLAGNSEMGVVKTTSVCFVKQMYVVDEYAVKFDDLALAVAGGRPERIADFPLTNRMAFASINIAIDIYLDRSQACGEDQYEQNEWIQTIKNLGVLRAYIWKVFFRFAISVYLDAARYRESFESALEEFEDLYVDMAYGNGRKAIIASFEQSILDLWYAFNDEWRAAWHPDDSTKIRNVQSMTSNVERSMEKMDGFMATYLDASEKDPAATLKTGRMKTVSRQLMLAHRLSADAVRAKFGDISSDEFGSVLAMFEEGHAVLSQAAIEERPDISALYPKIDDAWVTYRRMLTTLSTPGTLNRAEVMTSSNALQTLQDHLNDALELYAMPDVLLDRDQDETPYMLIAFCSIGSCLCCMLCFVIYLSVRHARRHAGKDKPAAESV